MSLHDIMGAAESRLHG